MNQKINIQFALVLCIAILFAACNQGGKTEEEAKTSDSTTQVTTETALPDAQDSSIDAVKVAPNLYKVVADTMGIRVLESNYKPGDSSVMHSHPVNAIYVVAGGTAEFTGKDGSKNVVDLKTGMTEIRPFEFHSVKNIGKTAMKVVLVEVNRPMGTVSQDAATDAVKVAPELYKVKNDSLGIRILEATYKPGQSSAMHSHPDNAIYVINGGKSEFSGSDGKKSVMELKTGYIAIGPSGSHSVKNIGTVTTKVLIVEVNRPMK